MIHVRPAALFFSIASALFLSSTRLSAAQDAAPATAPVLEPTTSPATAPAARVAYRRCRRGARPRARPQLARASRGRRPPSACRLGEGAEFQTGPKSACVCTIENDQTIVLDRLGVVSVAEAVRRGGDRADRPADEVRPHRVRDPGRRRQARRDDPQPQQHARRPRHAREPVRPAPVHAPAPRATPAAPSTNTPSGRRRSAAPGAGRSSAATAAARPRARWARRSSTPASQEARTNSDAKLIETEVSRGALANFDERTGITVIKGGAGPPGDAELASSCPGDST